ncbi:MAG: hypothetical protein ACYC4R_04820 [Anaerolineae bacterium]
MQGTITWTLSHTTLVGAAVVVLAVVGFQRGVNRELTTMLGIGAGILLSPMLSTMLAPMLTRVVQVVASGQGKLAPQAAPLLVLVVVVLGFVAYGQFRVQGPHSIVSRLLGLVAGGINGYLLVAFVLPRLTGEATTLSVAGGGAQIAEGSDVTAWMVVALVVVLIVFGLYSSRGVEPKGHE